MNSLFQACLEFQKYFFEKKWRFCFIGGLAVIRWGEPRMTRDIDISLLTGFGKEEIYIKDLITDFRSRTEDPLNFALNNRVLLLTASNGVEIDISLSGLPFEEQMIGRASLFDFAPGCSLLTASAEDIIILKSFADRPRDWGDVEGIIIKQEKELDFDYIYRNLKPLCEAKQDPGIIKRLKKLVETTL